MTPEIIEAMESLFDEWGRVKTSENKLDILIRRRKHFFLGWMLSFALNLFSISYSEYILVSGVRLGDFASWIFVLMLLASTWYVYDQFAFDDKLSRFGEYLAGRGGPRDTGGALERRLTSLAFLKARGFESMVEKFLKESGLSYVRDAKVTTSKGNPVYADFAVPSAGDPKYLIEIKSSPGSALRITTLPPFRVAKDELRGIVTVLVSDLKSIPPGVLKRLQSQWDHVVDLDHLEQLRNLIKA